MSFCIPSLPSEPPLTLQIEIELNPNCEGSEQFEFKTLGPPRPVSAIRIGSEGKESICDIIGVEKDGSFTGAFAVKIADSGSGYAYLISGGAWGIRLRPVEYLEELWNLSNRHQWGEPFKIYGSEEDLVYV